MSDRRGPNPRRSAFGGTTIVGFDVAAGTATLVSQNDGWPSYNIAAKSIFRPETVVRHPGVTPQRFWEVYTIGQDKGPALGLYMPDYGFETNEGWVWFVLNELIDFKDCAAGNRPGGGTLHGADLIRQIAEIAAAGAPQERTGLMGRIRRLVGGEP